MQVLTEKKLGDGVSLIIQYEREGIVIYLDSEDYSKRYPLSPKQWYNLVDATNEANEALKEIRAAKFSENGMGAIRFSNSICYKCVHVNEDGQSCKAFPDGIPGEILTGEVKHTDPYPGDNGIQFKLNKSIKR